MNPSERRDKKSPNSRALFNHRLTEAAVGIIMCDRSELANVCRDTPRAEQRRGIGFCKNCGEGATFWSLVSLPRWSLSAIHPYKYNNVSAAVVHKSLCRIRFCNVAILQIRTRWLSYSHCWVDECTSLSSMFDIIWSDSIKLTNNAVRALIHSEVTSRLSCQGNYCYIQCYRKMIMMSMAIF